MLFEDNVDGKTFFGLSDDVRFMSDNEDDLVEVDFDMDEIEEELDLDSSILACQASTSKKLPCRDL
ncbi:hypothetical protein X975_00504, partial [Stegodyphus mimosarum]